MSNTFDMPELPHSAHIKEHRDSQGYLYWEQPFFTAEQMHEYARLCSAAGQDLSAGTIEQVREAMRDMLNGWKYIRSTHGDLYGVGWDRAQDKVVAALALLPPPAASQQADHLRTEGKST